MIIKGSCHCGSVQYSISGGFTLIGNCHCSICRKTAGAAFVTWGLLNPGQFSWTAGQDCVEHYLSSPDRYRCFCKKCGASLASSHHGQICEVVVASVDGDPGGYPSEHIFVNSKAQWHEITDTLPQHAEWPPGINS